MRQVENSWREDLDGVSIFIDLFAHGIMTYIFYFQIACNHSYIKYLLSIYYGARL